MNLNSLQSRLTLGLVIIGLITLTLSYWNTSREERAMAEMLIEENLWHTAESYFDSINSLMLTGMMGNRSILEEKIMQRESMIEARIIRSEKTIQLYGPGHEGQLPEDELDDLALSGKAQFQLSENSDGRTMTVIQPLIASADYRGTDCLGCHAASEGDVLGAVRLTTSLTELDKTIDRSVTKTVFLQFLVIAVAFGVLSWFIHALIMKRLWRLRGDLDALEQNMDLTRSFSSDGKDEVAQLSNALDRMLQGFRGHLIAVEQSSGSLLDVAQNLKQVAEQTDAAVSEQKLQTDSVATALVEMEATSRDVKDRTAQANEQSEQTNNLSREGFSQAQETQTSIYNLSEHIQQAAEVIDSLDNRIQSVSTVLDVISGIAEQTNLLALNAAIEAARAGEQGRGFAVVADEVRSLATRTHESTDEIKETIVALQEEAQNAVAAMKQSNEEATTRAESVRLVAEKLSVIADQVQQMNDLNSLIAGAADQQNETAAEIQHNTLKIRDIAEQSEAVAEKAMGNSQKLVDMAEELRQRVSTFRL